MFSHFKFAKEPSPCSSWFWREKSRSAPSHDFSSEIAKLISLHMKNATKHLRGTSNPPLPLLLRCLFLEIQSLFMWRDGSPDSFPSHSLQFFSHSTVLSSLPSLFFYPSISLFTVAKCNFAPKPPRFLLSLILLQSSNPAGRPFVQLWFSVIIM